MVRATISVILPLSEIQLSFIRAPGPGGQNVNKVATAVLLRFNVVHSSAFTEEVRERLMNVLHARLTTSGDLIIKASRFRTQERNKQDALERLSDIIRHAATPRKKRHRTKPTYSSIQKRLENKKVQGKKKALRKSEINRD